ncbi:MAG: hypothetical protein U0T72_07040 [Chitinophagales bacterium]
MQHTYSHNKAYYFIENIAVVPLHTTFAMLNILQFILFAAYVVLLATVVWKVKWFALNFVSKKILLLAFLLKVSAGMALTLLYTYYYTNKQDADIYKYFEDGITLQGIFFHSPKLFFKLLFEINIETPEVLAAIKNFNHWDPKVRSMVYNDSRFIIKLNACIAFFSGKSIFIHSLLGSFIGFAGIVAIIKSVEKILPTFNFTALLLLFFPSVVFWTSALLKETVLTLAFGFFIWSATQIATTFNRKHLVFAAILFLLLALLKVYVLLCLIPPAAAFLFTRKQTSLWRITVTYIAVISLLVALAFAVDALLLHNNVALGIAQKQHDMQRLAIYMQSGSFIYIPSVDGNNTFSFLVSGIYGIFNVLLQPFIWSSTSPLLLVSAIENILLLVLIIASLAFIPQLSAHEWRLSLACIAFALLLFAIIGITTPVVGSIVRYRVPGLLLLLIPLSTGLTQITAAISTRVGSTEL